MRRLRTEGVLTRRDGPSRVRYFIFPCSPFLPRLPFSAACLFQLETNSYLRAGTGFGDLLHSGDHPDDDASSAYPHHLSLPNYEERFNRLEAMMAQVIEAGQSRGGAGRVSGESWAPHSGGGARKGSVAGTLVEEGAMNEKGTMQHV